MYNGISEGLYYFFLLCRFGRINCLIDIDNVLLYQSIKEGIGFQVVGEFQLLVFPNAENVIVFFRLLFAEFQLVLFLRVEYNVTNALCPPQQGIRSRFRLP